VPLKLFTEHFRINLDEGERCAMENLWQHNPNFDEPIDLLHVSLREGIKVMTRAAKDRQPELTRTQLEAGKRSQAQSAPQKGALHERAEAPLPKRKIENYTGLALEPMQQKSIDEFWNAHDYLHEEDMISILIDLGLRAADKHPEPFAMDAPKGSAVEHKENPVSVKTAGRKRRLKRLAQIRALHLQSRDR
jgi:hypothetical protein